MASKTKKQKQLEENIKKKIVSSHKAGLCNKNGRPYPTLSKSEPTTGWVPGYGNNYDLIDWSH